MNNPDHRGENEDRRLPKWKKRLSHRETPPIMEDTAAYLMGSEKVVKLVMEWLEVERKSGDEERVVRLAMEASESKCS